MATKAITLPSNPVEELRALAQAIPVQHQSDDGAEGIVAAILSKMTIEEVLTPASATALGELEGRPIIIHDVRRVEGGQNADLGFFLLVDVEDESTGNRMVCSTGAMNVVAQLAKAVEFDALPLSCQVKVTESKSNAGRMVQWLVTPAHF